MAEYINRINLIVVEALLKKPPAGEAPSSMPTDLDWVRQAFVLPVVSTSQLPALDPDDMRNRTYSSASSKYTDSSPGGNICINPPPQFTRYADIHEKGIRSGATDTTLYPDAGDIGMGRYYSEAIDDNNQIIHLRFGVAQYNSLFQFFTGFYSSAAGSAARAGRFNPGFINSFLRFGGDVISLAIAPLAIIPVAILMFGTAVRYFMRWPTSKFCTLKPSMEMYWNAVTSLVNQIGVNQGMIMYMEPNQKLQIMGQERVFDTPDYSVFSNLLPGIISKNGTLDVYRIAGRGKILEERHQANKLAAFERHAANGGGSDFFGVIKETEGTPGNLVQVNAARPTTSLEMYLERFIKLDFLSAISESFSGIEKDVKYPKAPAETDAATRAQQADEFALEKPVPDGFWSYFIANQADASDWVSFRVDYTGPIGESFSSSTAPSALAQKINDVSRTARDIRMNVSGGMIGEVFDAVGSVLGQIGSTLHIEGLAAAAGSCFVDIPQHWEASTAKLPQANYSMTLISPYGNPVSKMFNIWMPLAMLLAGALPLATGKQSHTSPFLCEVHDKGRLITRMGIIDNLTISRGVSNLGFNNEGQAMAVDVTFSVLDLSSIVAMPIQPGFSIMPAAGLFDAENAFSDYLMALSGMKLRDTIDRFPMLKYQAKKFLADVDTFTSAARWAGVAANLPGVNFLGSFMTGTTNRN